VYRGRAEIVCRPDILFRSIARELRARQVLRSKGHLNEGNVPCTGTFQGALRQQSCKLSLILQKVSSK